MEAEIRCGMPQSSQRVTQRYRADMCISMESGIEVEYGNSVSTIMRRTGTGESGWTNTSFLSFIGEDIEKEAEDIIFRIAPGIARPHISATRCVG